MENRDNNTGTLTNPNTSVSKIVLQHTDDVGYVLSVHSGSCQIMVTPEKQDMWKIVMIQNNLYKNKVSWLMTR